MFFIPERNLKVADNYTRFALFQGQKMGKGRVYFDVVVVRMTFDLEPTRITLAEHQSPVVLSDRYHDTNDASRSSLVCPGDLILGKPSTDVIVTGTARTRDGRPRARWMCSVAVLRGGTPLLDSRLVATGPRRFVHRALRGFRLDDPEPTLEVPIRYERAYGGFYENENGAVVYKTNPAGRGVFDESSLDKSASYEGPQWELEGSPVTSMNSDSPLAGFGPVGRMYAARLAYGGTYDAAWRARAFEEAAKGLPIDYPGDFDMRFFQCAHPALVAPAELRSGDVVRLTGLTEGGEVSFEIPNARPVAEVKARDVEWKEEPMALDLVHVDIDAKKVFLVWRMSLASDRRIIATIINESQSARG